MIAVTRGIITLEYTVKPLAELKRSFNQSKVTYLKCDFFSLEATLSKTIYTDIILLTGNSFACSLIHSTTMYWNHNVQTREPCIQKDLCPPWAYSLVGEKELSYKALPYHRVHVMLIRRNYFHRRAAGNIFFYIFMTFEGVKLTVVDPLQSSIQFLIPQGSMQFIVTCSILLLKWLGHD